MSSRGEERRDSESAGIVRSRLKLFIVTLKFNWFPDLEIWTDIGLLG